MHASFGTGTEGTLGSPAPKTASAAERFVWPPRPYVDAPPGPEPAPEPAAAPVERPAARALLHEIEAAWMGVTARSWHQRRLDAGWLADDPADYCPRCGSSVGPYEADGAGCSACRGKRLVWERCVRLGSYEGVLREAILTGKYTGWRRVCQDLGRDLGAALAPALRGAGIPGEVVVICPVPTSRRRRVARGVDHTAVLSREVARAAGTRAVGALRRRHRPPQQGLSLEARRENVRGAFRPNVGICSDLDGRLIVLVDDVRTTGATLSAAGRALREGVRKAGGRELGIWAAVLAVASRR